MYPFVNFASPPYTRAKIVLIQLGEIERQSRFPRKFPCCSFFNSITYQRGDNNRKLSLLDFRMLEHILEYKFWL